MDQTVPAGMVPFTAVAAVMGVKSERGRQLEMPPDGTLPFDVRPVPLLHSQGAGQPYPIGDVHGMWYDHPTRQVYAVGLVRQDHLGGLLGGPVELVFTADSVYQVADIEVIVEWSVVGLRLDATPEWPGCHMSVWGPAKPLHGNASFV